MRYFLFIAPLLLAMVVSAQKAQQTTKGFALIRGQVKNNTDTSFEYVVHGFLKDAISIMPVHKDGNFSRRIPIEPKGQEIGFAVGNLLSLFVEPGDTIDVNWDAKDAAASMAVSCRRADRDAELKEQLFVYLQFQPALIDLWGSYSRTVPDSVNFNKVSNLYNDVVTALLARPRTTRTNELITDLYYQYSNFLIAHSLLIGRNLVLKHPYQGTDLPFINPTPKWKPYQMESEALFRTSYQYREFLFNYVMTCFMPFMAWDTKDPEPYLQNSYYIAMGSFNSKEIRDWYITRLLINAADFCPFSDIETVYRDFTARAPHSNYLDTLQRFYADIRLLKPGRPAPAFVLKNEEGKDVSLADFKGKVVYIDFWGTYCRPCLADIRKSVPALHTRYKDKNVVFINICVDSDEKAWKESLRSLHLEGVNLIAEGWTHNKVCKDYQVNGIPHYFLVGADGSIVDKNAASPWNQYLFTQLDKLLN